ncbi:MAG: DNA mismatch repair protein MutT [Bacteroidetes bacterium]|nr:MAG: DNA mismatch repair protein MutT [Bacteroidota bacterium]
MLDEFEQAAARVLEQLTGLKVSIWSSYRLLEILAAIQWSEVFLLPTLLLLVFINMKSSSVIIIMLFPLGRIPRLIFDHEEMVERAKQKLQYKTALHPILFELLPQKFPIPQLHDLYEGIYDIKLDKRNFSRKVFSTKLLAKQKEKEKENSKRGAFYYKLDRRKYNSKFHAFLNFIPNPDNYK